MTETPAPPKPAPEPEPEPPVPPGDPEPGDGDEPLIPTEELPDEDAAGYPEGELAGADPE